MITAIGAIMILYYRYYLKVTDTSGCLMAGITPDYHVEQAWMTDHPALKIAVGDCAYPLGVAHRLAKMLQVILPQGPIGLKELAALGRRVSRKIPDYPAPQWFWLEASGRSLPGLSGDEREMLKGRMLSGGELASIFRFKGSSFPAEVEQRLHAEVLLGRAFRMPGIDRDDGGRVYCRRCGEYHNLSKSACVFCGAECWVCHACNALGTIRECIPLYQFVSEPTPCQAVPDFQVNTPVLTAIQAEAAEKVRLFCRDDQATEFLVWAVCGAGKTEVTYPAIAEAIRQGQRVLYAVPRRDVVREMGVRMAGAFPGIKIAVLFGGEGRNDEDSPHLTIATTHQVLRFSNHFHLAILDEADAYPYEGSRMLKYALQRAVRHDGKVLYLTATPTKELRERTIDGSMGFVTIPARHHGYPLPVPQLATGRLPSIAHKVPERLGEFLTIAHQKNAPVLIYLPAVEQVRGFGEFLRDKGEKLGWRVDWVYAESDHRDQAIADFRQGLTTVLVSSTVLERGVNFPGVDVVVLHADQERVFDVETLVQIAGRAGRFADKPHGRVLFLGERISRPMREAKEWIENMNMEALAKGLLKKETDPTDE